MAMIKENRKTQREESLKILYSMNMRNIYTEEFIDSYVEYNELNKNGLSYLYELLLEYLDHKDEIDNIIDKESENYKYNRLPLVDKCIIRLSTTEVIFLKIPKSVSINEAVEISKKYSDADSYKIVNSLLGKITRRNNDRI